MSLPSSTMTSRKPLGTRTNTAGHKTVKVSVKGKTSTLAKPAKSTVTRCGRICLQVSTALLAGN